MASFAGSCAFVGFHASVSYPGDFALVLIADLPAGTELFVTDNGVDAGVLGTGESTLVFSNQGADTVAGTVLAASNFTGTLSDLSHWGDQVLAYTGDSDAPTFRCALNVEGSSWQTSVSNTRESELPPGLYAALLAASPPAAKCVGSVHATRRACSLFKSLVSRILPACAELKGPARLLLLRRITTPMMGQPPALLQHC